MIKSGGVCFGSYLDCRPVFMKDYRNMSCVACQKPFDGDSDIVVCPECGAPHHRECWKETGRCACTDRHAEGYEWQPARIVIGGAKEPTPKAVNSAADDERVICPICGKETAKSEKYCERCGYYLAHDREGAYAEDQFAEFEELFDFDKSEPIEGVPAGDVRRFVGGMWLYYIPRFIRMSRRKGSLTFNFTAFLMHGLWFISRKMYAVGVLLTLMMSGISCYQVYFYRISEQLTGQRYLLFASLYILASGTEFLVMILSGLFGNRIYMKFCAKKIKKINAKASALHATADQFNEAIEEEGGVALLQTLSVGICYLAVLYILERGLLF